MEEQLVIYDENKNLVGRTHPLGKPKNAWRHPPCI